MRGALIDGGGTAHRGLQAPGRPLAGLATIPLEDLAAWELAAFDVIVVPRSCDADRLYARRHQVRRYLDRGGVLVSFGELWTDWLPGARWSPEAPIDVDAPPTVAPHPLLDGLGPDDLYWHRGPRRWCCHGHVDAPSGAEVLVANAAGGAWLYVDRVSTAGTIVSGSNLDLDTHAFHGNATAEALLGRLVDWVAGEAERTASLRDAASSRVLYAFSGVHFQRAFLDGPLADGFATLPVEELGGVDLGGYGGLWVPRESDQRAIAANAGRITAWLGRGGRAVVLEELDRGWLPGVSWRGATVALTAVRRADHPLVDALGAMERPWHGHGVVHLPPDAEVLVGTEDGGALLGIVRVGDGEVLVGTIDADVHVGYGSDLPVPFVEAAAAWLRSRELVPIAV